MHMRNMHCTGQASCKTKQRLTCVKSGLFKQSDGKRTK